MVATQIFYIFSPLFGEMIQFDEYFSNGLKPTTRKHGQITINQKPERKFWGNSLTHRIHGTGIFSYYKTIKVHQMYLAKYTRQPWILWVRKPHCGVTAAQVVTICPGKRVGR